MNSEVFTAKALIALFLASILGVHPLFWALLVITVIDFATGFLAAYVKKELSANVCKQGVARKAVMFLLVGAATIVGKHVGHLTGGAVSELPLGQIVAAFYVVNEMLSVVENAGIVGLPIPKAIRIAITKLRAINPAEDTEILTPEFKEKHGITAETKDAPKTDGC